MTPTTNDRITFRENKPPTIDVKQPIAVPDARRTRTSLEDKALFKIPRNVINHGKSTGEAEASFVLALVSGMSAMMFVSASPLSFDVFSPGPKDINTGSPF